MVLHRVGLIVLSRDQIGLKRLPIPPRQSPIPYKSILNSTLSKAEHFLCIIKVDVGTLGMFRQ